MSSATVVCLNTHQAPVRTHYRTVGAICLPGERVNQRRQSDTAARFWQR